MQTNILVGLIIFITPKRKKMAFSISKNLATQLVKNYFAYSQKTDIDTNTSRPLDPSKDTYTMWFSKAELDALFSANGGDGAPVDQIGLRVYLGQHWDTPLENSVPGLLADQGVIFDGSRFRGQQCVILVATLKNVQGDNVDQLQDNGSIISVTMEPGKAGEYGGPCPPPNLCLGAVISPF